MDARVSMSRASLREVAQATLGAWAAGLRKAPGHLTTRRSAGCARSDGGSVHGCKSVGRDTVGAGIEFAASCQGGDFLTDSLGGQCGIEAL
jgi:hypothetical protein